MNGRTVTVEGPKGTVSKDINIPPLAIRSEGASVIVEATNLKLREKALIGTTLAHLGNMITGVTKGFTYRLKMVYAHFPLSIKVDQNTVKIENFIGERAARVAAIVGQVDVKVDGEDVVVSGVDKEAVSQTAANIQKATHIRQYDPRVFSDGVYIYAVE
ncbi:MAG: 50S ribosomal protein L6 [Candidatus Marsarchaeota archaeon]|nr:50S ribosomal protein L6 [Candidatus Marsarchaeota archaeon]